MMINHYHFVLDTPRANLSRLMRHVNGVVTQVFNRRHAKVAHLFQGRFKAVLVDRDTYLLVVCRYVELNPVRAAIVDAPDAWPWSSHLAHVGRTESPPWLDTAGLRGYLLSVGARRVAPLTAGVPLGATLRWWRPAATCVTQGRSALTVERINAIDGAGDDQLIAHPRNSRCVHALGAGSS